MNKNLKNNVIKQSKQTTKLRTIIYSINLTNGNKKQQQQQQQKEPIIYIYRVNILVLIYNLQIL